MFKLSIIFPSLLALSIGVYNYTRYINIFAMHEQCIIAKIWMLKATMKNSGSY